MLNSYHRRAFLVLSLCALEPAATAANAHADTPAASTPPVTPQTVIPVRSPEPETLWDVLSRIDRDSLARATQMSDLTPPRVPMGAVPGFTLPGNPKSVADNDLFNKKKKNTGPFAPVNDWLDRMEKATGSSVKMSGAASLSLRSDSVSGGSSASQSFQNDQYLGNGSNGLYTDANLHIDMTLFNSLHYATTINNNLYQRPDSNTTKLDYATKSVKVEAGDINAGFKGNSLIDFSRYLRGVQVTNIWSPQFKSSILFSQNKAQPQTQVIQGNDTSGPYFVFSGQIVDGSAQVRVDNIDKVSGKDYTLNPLTGELQFLNGQIVLHTSTIAVSYEVLGAASNSSNIYGLRTEFTRRGGAGVGVTVLEQTTQSAGAIQQVSQQFQANASPLTPYTLDYPIDITKLSLDTVTIDNVPQTLNVDYTIDPAHTYQFLLVKPQSPTAIVLIKYYPVASSISAGNRRIVGLDSKVPLGKLGSLSLETALSSLSLSGDSNTGQAIQIRANLNPLRHVHTDITLKDVGPSFTSIQSVGFNTNEKSYDIASDYTPIKTLHFTVDVQKAKRPSYSSTTSTTQTIAPSIGNDTYNQYSLGASYNFTKNGTLSLQRNDANTKYIIGGSNDNLTDSLRANYHFGQIGLQAALSRNNSTSAGLAGTALTGTTSASSNIDSSTLSKQAGITWNPNNWFRLTGNLADNSISNSGIGLAAKSHSSDTELTAGFKLKRGFSIDYSYGLTNTGNLGNNGTSAASTGTTGTTSTGTTGVATSGTTASRLALLNWLLQHMTNRDSTTGTSTSSTTSTSTGSTTSAYSSLLGGGTNYSLGSGGNYSGYQGTGLSNGISSLGGRSSINRIALNYSPTKKIQTQIALDTSNSVGDYQYNSNRNNITLRTVWAQSSRMSLTAGYNIQRIVYTGSLGNTSTNALQLSMEGHPFGKKLGVNLSYQFTRNLSSLNTAALTAGSTTTATTTTPTTTGLTANNSNISDFHLFLDYPISHRQSLFFDYETALASGSLGTTDNNIKFGFDFTITQTLKFSLGWQLLNHLNTDPTQAAYNYKTSSALAQFNIRY